ncbi:hypothetical protein ABDK00_000785 [Niabella insulamsoli]
MASNTATIIETNKTTTSVLRDLHAYHYYTRPGLKITIKPEGLIGS